MLDRYFRIASSRFLIYHYAMSQISHKYVRRALELTPSNKPITDGGMIDHLRVFHEISYKYRALIVHLSGCDVWKKYGLFLWFVFCIASLPVASGRDNAERSDLIRETPARSEPGS